jgi:hypothetical protein
VLIGPLSLLAACLCMAGGSLWIPPGAAAVNNLALPIVLFPLLWTGLFLYACLDKRLGRAYAVIGILAIANAAAIAVHLMS